MRIARIPVIIELSVPTRLRETSGKSQGYHLHPGQLLCPGGVERQGAASGPGAAEQPRRGIGDLVSLREIHPPVMMLLQGGDSLVLDALCRW